jgi:alpha-mannosidase
VVVRNYQVQARGLDLQTTSGAGAMKTISSGLASRGLPLVLAVAALGCCRGVMSAEPVRTAPTTAKDTFFFIPHTHWEGAVFKTREEYLDIGLPNILRALALLKAYPDYRFVLDQACYVKPFLERYPEEEAALRKFVEEGRLAIVGGTDVMLDVNMPGGESFVRQVLYGKGYFRQKLGVDVKVGWQLDTFGHHAQMPQLLKLGGYQSFWFFRGVADWTVPAEFFWEGIDGSRIPAFWLPHGYAHTYGSPQDLPAFADFFTQRFDALAPFARGAGRVGLAGADVCEPETHVPALVEQFNRRPDAPFELRIAVPTDYEAFVAQRPDRPVVTGELNPIFQGSYSSRIELKQRTRELERLLTTAEKLGVLLRSFALPVDEQAVWRAWEPMLFNQAHDLMSGVMTDRVYDDTIRSYDFSQRIAGDEVRERWRDFAARINTQGEGMAIAVFNALGWPRTDIAITDVGFTDSNVMDLSLVGPDGQGVPVQLLTSARYASGGLLRAEIAFVARDVPPLGYAVYRLVPRASPAAAAANLPDEPVLENEHYRLEFNPAGGAMTRLLVKSNNWEALRGPGNVVVREEDRGDLWEPYKPLDGGSRIAMKTQLAVPQPGQGVFSNEQTDPLGTVTRGPVVSEFKISHAFGAQGTFATTVRLYANLRRIDIRTRILNQDQFVRYRVLFPTAIQGGQSVHEIPFGSIQRPAAIEFPAQNWIDYGNGQQGVALLNRGLPGNTVADGTMMLSLLRSTRIVAYGFGGGYEPGMSSDSGLQLGKEFTFDYALVPHAGDWRQATIYREGLEFNQPLLACALAPHPGELPNRWGLLEIAPRNVVLTALKPGPDGTAVLRVYEADGVPTQATIRLSAPIVAAEEVNLMEDSGPQRPVTDNALRFDLRAFEIKTFKLRLGPGTTASR